MILYIHVEHLPTIRYIDDTHDVHNLVTEIQASVHFCILEKLFQLVNNKLFDPVQHCIRELVSSVAKQNDIPLNREPLDNFVLMVLYEACSPVSSSAAKTAVQLLFGRAHLVSQHFLCMFTLIL